MYARTFGRGVVATPHYLASTAGLEVLLAGGNAVDAIVAANLALGVVAPYYCGYGGDLLAIVHDGTPHGYRSTGKSPAATSIDKLRREGCATMPAFGPHAVTVPGAILGWFELLDRFGTRSFGELAARAVALARDGFTLTRPGAFRIRGSIAMIEAVYPRGAAALSAAYDGAQDGAQIRLPFLARTIEALASDGPDAYYRGPIGKAIVATLQQHGSPMTEHDLELHTSAWVTPLRYDFAGRTVLELPPPTQGITALEMLALAEATSAATTSGFDRDHLHVEVAKLALADRDRFVGDPAAMTVDPMQLVATEHIADRRALIGERSRPMEPRPATDGGTAYLCAADADGLSVSLIQSNFTAIGAGVHVPEWGINLHNRGASFSLDDGHVNALAGAKLPMHTLIPALVMRDRAVEYVFGTMGGHAQAQVHLQVLTRLLVDGNDPQSAIDAPRWSVDPADGMLNHESRFGAEWAAAMDERGHVRRCLRAYDDGVGHAHAIERIPEGFRAGCDPRAESAVLGI